MKTKLLDYALPQGRIAVRPPLERDGGLMLEVRKDELLDRRVGDLVDQLREGDLVVLNETKVRRARLMTTRPITPSGGGAKVELLVVNHLLDGRWEALGKANKPLRVGDVLKAGDLNLRVDERGEGGVIFLRADGDLEQHLARAGEMPIPPYMLRSGDDRDDERYQTVFAKELGSSAAPTAGLHLTEDALKRAQLKGVEISKVLLHVGIGTFRPVGADDLDDHDMHSEHFETTSELASAITRTRARGGRVVAVGTTVVRALESAARHDELRTVSVRSGETTLLIQPGYRFAVVDALLTNFHQPKSTLLALVGACVGLERLKEAYAHALAGKYRFLSYGDAMWLPRFEQGIAQ